MPSAWHDRGTAKFASPKPLKIRVAQGSDTSQLSKSQFWQLKQRLALFAASLRGVWKKYEDRRSEYGVACQIPEGSAGQKPAYGEAQSATTSFWGHVPRTLATALLAALLASGGVSAEGWSSSGSFDLKETEKLREKIAANPSARRDGWDFAARQNRWVALDDFERARPGKLPPKLKSFSLPSGSQVDQLYALIAFAEAPRGRYNAIHHGAKILPAKKPTQLTLAEIYQWIDDTPGQPHAIGNFQIIPSTLLNLQQALGLPDTAVFSRVTQERMAAVLLKDAGYHKFISGRISRGKFMDNLARIWAGFPLQSGKSAYHGYAGNRATITRTFFEAQMVKIFGSGAKPRTEHVTAHKGALTSGSWQPLGQ